jgi:hypothetical protein
MSAEDVLIAAKAECLEGESLEEHEAHREKLAAAYADFAAQSAEESNPAPPGEVTQIDAAIVAQSAMNEPPPEAPPEAAV